MIFPIKPTLALFCFLSVYPDRPATNRTVLHVGKPVLNIFEESEFIRHFKGNLPVVSMSQDANPHHTACVNFNGVVQRQYSYAPYGEVLSGEAFGQAHLHPIFRVGFQGLFTDRLDTDLTRQPLEPDAPVLLHARNRTYHPRLGRWLQRDPNATGQPLLEALAINGQTFVGARPFVDVETRYRDGINVFQFVRCNPCNERDANGLSICSPMTDTFSLFAPGSALLPASIQLAMMGGYLAGAMWAHMDGGWGPSKMSDRLAMATSREFLWDWGVPTSALDIPIYAGLNFLPWATKLTSTYGDLSALPMAVRRGIQQVNTVACIAKNFWNPLNIAAPIVGAAAGYLGVLDSVMWTVDNDW